jgi:phosphoglycolate phosphatase-like HAD superfamily hydrolase
VTTRDDRPRRAPQSAGEARLHAVFFDFDGVILESADIKTEAIIRMIPELSPAQREELRRYHLEHVGISRYVKFDWAYRELLGREITEDESARLGQEYSHLIYDKVAAAPFVPGVPEVLEELATRLPLFVVSGTPREEVKRLAEHRRIDHFFEEIWGSPAQKTDIVRDLLRRYDLAPARSLFIGDGLTDYEAARNTGLHFLARDTADHRHVWDRLSPPRVDDLRDLPALVASWPAPAL